MSARDLAAACALSVCLVATPGWCLPQAVSAGQTVPAADQADPFRLRVDRAAQLMDTDPQAAMESLNHLAVESIELRKTRPLVASERPAHRLLFVLRGRAHMQAMSDDAVDESYRELLRVDPFFAQALAPREQAVLDALRTRESGLLEVTSTVRGCTVFVDGVEVGVTGDAPVRASLVHGSFEVRLEKPGYQGVGTRITIVATETRTVADLTPKAQVPPLLFLADRSAVEVSVANAHAGVTIPLADLRGQLSADEVTALDRIVVEAGFDATTSAGYLLRDAPVNQSILLRFRGQCLVEEVRTVSIAAESLVSLDAKSALLWYGDQGAVRLKPDVGTLRVTSAPSDADVYVDGALTGRTPFERGVCAGEHKVRVRHRLGSYTVGASVARGRTEVLDVVLKPGLAFLGAVANVDGTMRPAAPVTSIVDRALASTLKSFRPATLIDVPTTVQRWNDALTTDLVTAADRRDTDSVTRLLRLAQENFDAPLLLAVAALGPDAAANGPVEVLLFWFEHSDVERVRLPGVTEDALAGVLAQIDGPVDASELIFQNDLGFRLADTGLAGAPLLVISVEPGSPAAMAGLKPGDSVTAVDGALRTSADVAQRVRQCKPGEVLRVSAGGPGGRASQVAIPVQRRPRRSQAFDPGLIGHAMTARLQALLAVTPAGADRDLITVNLALLHMRFNRWRQAIGLLASVTQVPSGIGIGPESVRYFRARCHEELGERDRALMLYREAAASGSEVLADDGATVAALAALRVALLTDTTVVR